MKKQKPPASPRTPAKAVPHEFERHGITLTIMTRAPVLVPLGENTFGITFPSDGEPRGLDSVRQIAKETSALLDTRGVSHNVRRLAEKGYGPLSDEGLAARLLAAAEGMLAEGAPLEYRLGKAVELGRVETLFNIM